MIRVVTLGPGSSLQRQIAILVVTVLSMVFCAAGIYQVSGTYVVVGRQSLFSVVACDHFASLSSVTDHRKHAHGSDAFPSRYSVHDNHCDWPPTRAHEAGCICSHGAFRTFLTDYICGFATALKNAILFRSL